jgi:histidine phosphotransferase ChpT
MQDIDLVALMGSRLCHDLLGPTSAVVNGLELITSEPEVSDEALQMVARSADQLSRRLQFYRGAYGVASGLTYRAAHDLAEAYFGEGRVRLAWATEPEALDRGLPKGTAKLALNLLLLGADILGRGGTMALEGEGRPRPMLDVTIAGEGLRDDVLAPDWTADAADPVDPNPRTAQPVFVARLARSLGARVAARRSDRSRLSLTAAF